MSGQLKEVRDRIKSVENTQQITKAMKMVSAAKLRRAQQAIVEMRPYANRLNQMLRNILSNLDGNSGSSFGVHRDIEKVIVVVVTSSKGLCGAFNTNVIKETVRKINEDYSEVRENGGLRFLCIGKKGFEYFKKHYSDCEQITGYVDLFGDLSYENVNNVAQFLMDEFSAGEVDRVDVSYARFKNAAIQFPECVQFLPVEKVEKPKGAKTAEFKADYIFEPDMNTLLEYLIPNILSTTFFKFNLDTHASEHGARMTAMDNATENAEEIKRDLRVSYNKARQEAITKELSEIVGGAAALEG